MLNIELNTTMSLNNVIMVGVMNQYIIDMHNSYRFRLQQHYIT